MQAANNPLFQPFTLKSLTTANRIVMAPMTRGFSDQGLPTQAMADYYRRRAEGGVGLIVTEGTVVSRPAAKNRPGIPHIHGDALTGWKRIVDAVHAAGGKIAPQLWHVGAMPDRRTQWAAPTPFEGPSRLSKSGAELGQEMSGRDVEDTIAAFGRAATDAKAVGFDAIELHGAHGYLIDQFFWDETNQRSDRWNGPSIRERSRFAIEVVKAVRAAIGLDFPLILRLSQWKIRDYGARIAATPDEMAAWLEPLADAGVDMFHCSQRRFWEPEFEGSALNFAGWARKITGKPTITVGSIGLTTDFMSQMAGETTSATPMRDLAERLDRGEFDLVAVGRSLIADPEWPVKIAQGREHELVTFESAMTGTLR